VYGPTDRAVFPLFQAAARGLMPLVGREDAAYTFVHIDDVVRSIVAAVERTGVSGPVFVGHPVPVTPRDLLEAIQLAVGRSSRMLRVPMPLTYVVALAAEAAGRITGRPMPINLWRYREMAAEGFVCRVDRLRDELGVTPGVGLREGIARTAAWYREVGWITP
jgi:nucleoside-diphosphate-sugar epimerase